MEGLSVRETGLRAGKEGRKRRERTLPQATHTNDEDRNLEENLEDDEGLRGSEGTISTGKEKEYRKSQPGTKRKAARSHW
jgi:hypothetical protein